MVRGDEGQLVVQANRLIDALSEEIPYLQILRSEPTTNTLKLKVKRRGNTL